MIVLFSSGGAGVFSVFFIATFVLVFGVIIWQLIRSMRKTRRNRRSPRLTVPARVVARTSQVSGGGRHTSASTTYYATFEVESGDRIELDIDRSDFAMLAEGDQGRVTFRGTEFLEFVRD